MPATDIMQLLVQIGQEDPHIKLHRGLRRRLQELLAVIPGLSNGGIEDICGVEDAIGAITEPATSTIQMREGGHNIAGSTPGNAVLRGHELQLTHCFPYAVIGETLKSINGLKIVRISHTLE